MENSKLHTQTEEILRDKKLKLTPSRVGILMLLMQKDSPMTVEEIQGLLKHAVNKTTVYRALDSFVEKGILYQTHLRDGKTYYEYQNEHHHHIVCTSCGTKEEVPLCIESSISKISRQSKKFRVIQDHMLEFFGICNTCSS